MTVLHPLLALALRCTGPGDDADIIAPAIVQAVEARARRGLPPVTESPAGDICLLGVFARHESGASLFPRPQSHDARDGTSCGPWQQDCRRTRGWSLRHQAAAWLADASHGIAGVCGVGDAAARVAEARLDEERAIVREALSA